MVVLIYDASWFGFLTAVFEVYDRKLQEVSIITSERYQPVVFGDYLKVDTDTVKAERVWNGMKKKLSAKGFHDIYSCYLSGLPDIENQLLAMIRLTLSLSGAEYAYGNTAVLKVSQVAKMVHREKHRMEAFIRFKLTKDDIYYAIIEPDFNVIPLILNHFKRRYADQKWLIYDVKRKYGIYYNLDSVEEVYIDFNENETGSDSVFCDSEVLYQTLWKDYFEHVNIVERKNTKLHLRHVPKRYWKHLTEKQLY